MKRNKKASKALSFFMALALTAGNLSPAAVKADTITVDKNILQGLIPTTNAEGGITNPEAATDGINYDSDVDANNTRIECRGRIGGDDNGYSQWNPVYLQYDFGDVYSVKAVILTEYLSGCNFHLQGCKGRSNQPLRISQTVPSSMEILTGKTFWKPLIPKANLSIWRLKQRLKPAISVYGEKATT